MTKEKKELRGVNIEYFGPKVDKSKNGYGTGWAEKECRKSIYLILTDTVASGVIKIIQPEKII